MTTTPATIAVARALAPILASRDMLSVLKNAIEQAPVSRVSLDFSDVEFISRSAAHELLTLKDAFRNQPKPKVIEFLHTRGEVTDIIRLVAASRAVPSPKRRVQSATPLSIDVLQRQNGRPFLKLLKLLFVH